METHHRLRGGNMNTCVCVYVCEPFSVCVCVCRNPSAVVTERTYCIQRRVTHTHTRTRDRNYCFGTRVLHYHRRFLFSQIWRKAYRMHAHTHTNHTHKHTCISPLEVVDTTRDRYNIAHTHRFLSVGRCAPKSVYITSFFCFPMCRQII